MVMLTSLVVALGLDLACQRVQAMIHDLEAAERAGEI
jgi:hypothetical protein